MSVTRVIADHRTNDRVPHTVVCSLLGVSLAWLSTWLARAQGPGALSDLHTTGDRRRSRVDRAVRVVFETSRGLHGSPRLVHDLGDAGWSVSQKTGRGLDAPAGTGGTTDQAQKRPHATGQDGATVP